MTKNNLIIGNGVNLNSDCLLSTRAIINRIEERLIPAINFLDIRHNSVYLRDLQEAFDFKKYAGSIEDLLFGCMRFVMNKRKEIFEPLTEQGFLELLTLLKRVFINAMFIIDNELIDVVIPGPVVKGLRRYNKIFSLNYYEFWDDENETIHLHGKIDYRKFNKDDYVVEHERRVNDVDYAAAIDDYFAVKYDLPIENLSELIMLPIGFAGDKNEIRQLDRKYQQFGFLVLDRIEKDDREPIYSPLENLEDITLYGVSPYGVSPYGDDLLMKTISNIPKVSIYVYEMDKNSQEIRIWKDRVPHAYLIDSREFLSG